LSLHRRTHGNFSKKDYRILNADLNKKNKLRQPVAKTDPDLKRLYSEMDAKNPT